MIKGFYGLGTPCKVCTYTTRNGSTWYCVKGSKNINKTYEPLEDGVDVETINDVDTYTSDKPINTDKQLEKFIND